MKKSGLIAASMAAASATAISASSSTSSKIHFSHQAASDHCGISKEKSTPQESSSSDKFAPRFDGLRFIETLVTAHR